MPSSGPFAPLAVLWNRLVQPYSNMTESSWWKAEKVVPPPPPKL